MPADNVEVREASQGEHEEYLRLYYSFYRELRERQGWPPHSLEEYRGETGLHLQRDKVFLAYSGGRPVGFVRISERDESYWIEELYVRPEYRGLGIAKTLVEKAEEYIAGHDPVAYIMVTPQDTRALSFWLHMGYTTLNTIELAKELHATRRSRAGLRTVEFMGYLLDTWRWRREEYDPKLARLLDLLEEYRRTGGSRERLLDAFAEALENLIQGSR